MITEQVDRIFEQMKEYEKANFGLKNGEDFPEIARVLMASMQFKQVIQRAAMLGMIGMLSLPKKEELDKADPTAFLSDTPLRQVLADVFFAGYQIGKQQTEISQLVTLADKP